MEALISHLQTEVDEHCCFIVITGGRLTIPVPVVEASGARRPPAQARRQGAAAAAVTVGVLWHVLGRGDIEGGVAGIH